MADRATIESLLGATVRQISPLHGGDLSEVTLVMLDDGTRVVAKTGPLVAAEARMLRAIDRAGAPAPKVLAVSGTLLILEYLAEAAASPSGWAALGHALATLHADEGQSYGWGEDYAFGQATLPNTYSDDWCQFWGARRLLAWPDKIPSDIAHRVERLVARLPDLLPPHPRPALLHGDLWAGNVLFTGTGAAFIDPACYYGHGEVDLAMLTLFGSPGPSFMDTYGPPESGWQDRRAIYQLWPALVHLRLFGGGYRSMVDRCLTAVGA
ncbi:fructosamine kinase family protein [Rhodovulum sp. P5]|uniref:fructosamine kinase family protein n=1 Tax=Rhodovulum sp. P5 TaxID=1564506 RepID=UPI0009D92D3A|nr:fructosamine kinase family protein [Rhodovulum sp. P5]